MKKSYHKVIDRSSRTGDKNMRSNRLLAFIIGLLGLCCAFTASGQTQRTQALGQYVISAKAGGVNFVSGKVTVTRRSGTSGLLLQGDEIQIGDRITTGEDGKAEVLLNPGSYLRVGPNTSFDFASTDLEDLRVNLRTGSAVFEIIATDEFKVTIKMPQSDVQLTNSGVFRIDVQADGTAKLSVFKGKAYVGPASRTEVGSGRTATVGRGGGVSVAKFDRDTDDPLDIWSKDRAKELTRLNAKLERDSLRNSLLTSFNNRGWNLYNSFGLWVFDPRFGRFLFLPFGYGWSSPYGWDYDYDLWRCRMPWYIWSPTYNTPTAPTGSGGSGYPPRSTTNEARRQRMHTPPFQRVEREIMTSGRSDVSVRPSFPDSRRSDSTRDTSTSPVMTAPPIVIAPSSSRPPDGTTKGRPD